MDRKDDHIRVCLEEQVDSLGITAGFEAYRFDHDALPELDRKEISLEVSFMGKTLQAPIMIGAMTGGTAKAGAVNRILAEAAEATGVALALGSQRPMLENPQRASSYAVRDVAPNVFLAGNVGAVQLNYGVDAKALNALIESSKVDVLTFHLNPLQEAIQPGGDTNFKGLMEKLADVIPQLSVPVLLKEVGSGFSAKTVGKIGTLPIAGIEVAGVGGTSWAKVESHRTPVEHQQETGVRLSSWGIPTSESIQIIRHALPTIPIISSGGVRSGLDIAKSIALGANIGAMARPFLVAAQSGVDEVIQAIEGLKEELRTVLFVCGASSPQTLRDEAILRNRNSGKKVNL